MIVNYCIKKLGIGIWCSGKTEKTVRQETTMTRHETVGEKCIWASDSKTRKIWTRMKRAEKLMILIKQGRIWWNRMKAATKTIPIVGGIPDSLGWITDPNAQDSGFHNRDFLDFWFHKQKFSIFQNPDSLPLGEFYDQQQQLYFSIPTWVNGILTYIIQLHGKFLQFDWLRAVVFQLNLKYLRVKIINLLV